MAHTPKDVKQLVSMLRMAYPDTDVYTVATECKVATLESAQRPDAVVVAKYDPTLVICVAELGKASQKRLQTFIDAGIPDVRWYTFELEGGMVPHINEVERKRRKSLAVKLAEKYRDKYYAIEQRKWNHTLRYNLYRDLLLAFGPARYWVNGRPASRVELEDLLVKEAAVFNAQNPQTDFEPFTPESIKQQLDWALRVCSHVKPTQIHTWMCNKVAAYEAGFIDASLMPKGNLTIK